MTFFQLLDWVNNSARTDRELKAACAGLGLPQTGNQNALRTRLQRFISTKTSADPSPFTPVGWVAPIPPTTPAQPFSRGFVFAALGIALLVAIIAFLIGSRPATTAATAATPTTVPTTIPTTSTLTPAASATPKPTATITSTPTTTPKANGPVQGCPGAKFTRYDSHSTFTVTGPSIVHPYRDGQPQYRVLLRAGETTKFKSVKGDRYDFENTDPCNKNMDFEFAKGAGAYAAKTVAELRQMGWVE